MTEPASPSPPETLLLVDTHCHLTDPQFAADLDAVLARARAAGVAGLLAMPTDLPSSRACLALAERHADIWCAVGIHPNSCELLTTAEWAEIAALAEHPRVVAIGETGLDYYRDWTQPERQRSVLARHIALAQRLGKPIVIHNREADADIAADLGAAYAGAGDAARSGVLHCYGSAPALALGLLGCGFFVSFGGNLTYKRAEAVRAAALALPLDRLLLETDAPYLAPEPRRGRRNEPAYVAYTARRLAELRGLESAAAARLTTANAARLFGFAPAAPVALSNDRAEGA